MRKRYPSDTSPEQLEVIKPLLESARRKTSPRRVDLYEVFCAVLYLLRRGCQWGACSLCGSAHCAGRARDNDSWPYYPKDFEHVLRAMALP